MNIYKKINDWLLNYVPLDNWIYFNATPLILGAVAMNSVSGDRVTKKFVDGSQAREVIFAIDMIKEYDSLGTSDINIYGLNEVNNFADWIESQNTKPDFGNDNTIESIEVLTNVPSIYIDKTQNLAKYQFQVKIKYKKEREEYV